MRGKIVATQFGGQTSKHKLDRIDFDKKVTDKMEGKEITYLEYFTETYAVTIEDETQPMAVDTEGTYQVPSLCQMTSIEKGHPLNIICYNLLAKGYDDPKSWSYVRPEVLNFEYRGPRIIKELSESQADLICLQEFSDKPFFEKELETIGYSLTSYINEHKVHGLAIAYKKTAWKLEGDIKVIDYTKEI